VCNNNVDDDDNGKDNNHGNLVGNEAVNVTSDQSAQHNNQLFDRGKKDMPTKRKTMPCLGG
jgi:hypothetical protein